MEESLSIKDAAKYLGVHYNTAFNKRFLWGFFRMPGSRIWRISKTDLDLLKNRSNNTSGFALSVDEVKLCRSTKEKRPTGLLSQPQVVKELDALLKQW